MSLWGFDGEDNTLATWSSLSQFDDMVWSEFGHATGDHVVPDPDPDTNLALNPDSPQFCILPSGGPRKRIAPEQSLLAATLKGSTTSITIAEDSFSDISRIEPFSEEEGYEEGDEEGEEEGEEDGVLLQDAALPTSLADDEWSDLGIVPVGLTAEQFGSEMAPGSRDSEDDVDCDENMKNLECSLEGEVGLDVCGDDASMVTVPCSLSEVVSQDRTLDMFENEIVPHKMDSLLELGWENIGNLDDMEKLFRSDSSFEPEVTNGTDELDWTPTSSVSPNVGGEVDQSPMCELAAVKLESDEDKGTSASDFGDRVALPEKNCLNAVSAECGNPSLLDVSAAPTIQQQSLPYPDKNRSRAAKPSDAGQLKKATIKEESSRSCSSLPEPDKANVAQAYRARRHAASRKRSEERFKRSTSYRKLSPGPPYNINTRQVQSLPLCLPGQPPHLQPSTGYPLHFFSPTVTPGMICGPQQLQLPQGVPYIQLGYPIRPMAPLSACPPKHLVKMQQHPQPLYVDLQGRKQAVPPQPSPMASSVPFDASTCPPISSPSMTKQEKLEKLRWRQRMQARIAVEQQEQLLASQNGEEIQAPAFLRQQQSTVQDANLSQSENVSTPTGPSEHMEKQLLVSDQRLTATDKKGMEDFSLEDSVLSQLKCIVSTLDPRARICIRDALYRLAKSAMKRMASGEEDSHASDGTEEQNSDANGVDSSTDSGPPSSDHSRATSMSLVESETNPIDRTIAKLLFSKPSPSVFTIPN